MKSLSTLIFTLMLAIGFATRAHAISYAGGTYTQDFDIMGAAGTTTPTGWFVGVGTGAAVTGTTVVADAGGNPNFGNYNYGVAGTHLSDERALGSIADRGQFDTEVDFQNNTTFAVTQFTLSYTGEEWRDGGSGSPNTLILQLSTDGLTWTPLGAAFNFTSPINNAGLPTALDGNAAANRVTNIGGTFSLSTAIPIGANFFFRFADADDPNKDSGIAVDDFSFRAVPEPSAYMLLGIGLLLCGQRFLRHRSA